MATDSLKGRDMQNNRKGKLTWILIIQSYELPQVSQDQICAGQEQGQVEASLTTPVLLSIPPIIWAAWDSLKIMFSRAYSLHTAP
jgi:hypothetical protein